jgi:pSer/pThr/pTyr-binding forkhead associated (FHA) protein
MTFDAHMRIGSLEITAALLAVAVVAARPRVRAAAEIGRMMPMRVAVDFSDLSGNRSYEGRPPFEVGRGRELDVVLHDPEVSRRHARFESRNGIVYVDDLKSSNGTFLNGRRVTEAIEIREGDAVDVGTTRLLVRSVQPWT